MIVLFHEIYHFVLGIGVLTIFRGLAWLRKRNRENLENMVLNTFGHRNWPWLSAYGVVARLKHNAAHEYAPALFPPRVTGLYSLMAWVRVIPYHVGYFYRRTFLILNRQKIVDVLRDLFKRQIIICSPENPSLYRLKRMA